MKIRKITAAAATLFCAVSLAACSSIIEPSEPTMTQSADYKAQHTSFRWASAADLAAAEAGAGFTFDAPQSVNGLPASAYAFKSGFMVQVAYGKEGSNPEIYVRKAAATDSGDVSDDSGEVAALITLNGMPAKVKKGGEGFTSLIWTQDGYDYAVTVVAGTTQENILAIAKSVAGGKGGSAGSDAQAETANPWTDCASAAEAAGISGVSINAPASPDGYSEKVYRAMAGLAEVIYVSDSDPSDMIVARKARATADGDVSGVTGSFDSETEVAVGDSTGTLRSAGGLGYVLIRTDGEYDYSVYFTKGASAEKITAFASEVN